MAVVRASPSYRRRERAKQKLYERNVREVRRSEKRRQRQLSSGRPAPPAPKPRCFFCGEFAKTKDRRRKSCGRLRVVERMIVDPNGRLRPARVLWCGKC
jgi:hypothetical protein